MEAEGSHQTQAAGTRRPTERQASDKARVLSLSDKRQPACEMKTVGCVRVWCGVLILTTNANDAERSGCRSKGLGKSRMTCLCGVS